MSHIFYSLYVSLFYLLNHLLYPLNQLTSLGFPSFINCVHLFDFFSVDGTLTIYNYKTPQSFGNPLLIPWIMQIVTYGRALKLEHLQKST